MSSTTLKNKSGVTSEDTADEYKPSSLLDSSGFPQGRKYYSQSKLKTILRLNLLRFFFKQLQESLEII